MRCRPEFITAQRKTADATAFAAYVRNLTPTALSLSVPFGALDRLPQMTQDAHAALRARNRERYAARSFGPAGPMPPATPTPPTVALDDDDWSSGTTES